MKFKNKFIILLVIFILIMPFGISANTTKSSFDTNNLNLYDINDFMQSSKFNIDEDEMKVNNYYKKDIINISILGDSISTFDGVSNDALNSNSTLGINEIFYDESNYQVTLSDTYWKQLIDQTGMNLLVNNSSSGSKVVGLGNQSNSLYDQGIGARSQNLHADTGINAGTNPDIILVYMGLNDLGSNYEAGSYEETNFELLIKESNGIYIYEKPNNFTEGYAIMLHKIKIAYPKAKVYVMNLPSGTKISNDDISIYNDSISKLANKYDMYLIDLYNSELSGENYNIYSIDGLHPNVEGMDIMTNIILNYIDK